MIPFVVIALFSTLALAAPARAAQPLITDDTGTQGRGGQQVELSQSSERASQAGLRSRSRASGLTYTFGVSEQADVFLGTSFLGLRPANSAPTSGWGSNVLGAKWRLWDLESSKTSLAIKPEWIMPVSGAREFSELGVGKASYALTLIATQEVPFGAIHLNAQMGRDRFRNAQDNERHQRLSVASVWDVSVSFKLALDLGQQTVRRQEGPALRSRFVEIGTIYSPSKSQDWALGLIRSSDNDSPQSTSNTLTGGWTLRF